MLNHDVRLAHAREPRAEGGWAVAGLATLLLVAGLSSLRASPPQNPAGQQREKPKPQDRRRRNCAGKRHSNNVMTNAYWGWLHEEVPYIITARERKPSSN